MKRIGSFECQSKGILIHLNTIGHFYYNGNKTNSQDKNNNRRP